ncbi:MAG TPA: hypothetical protein DEP35_17200 [Deltaproteobacteria bacterium]|nr:hypothetical protein [Deltaproteobacteria bacterium]
MSRGASLPTRSGVFRCATSFERSAEASSSLWCHAGGHIELRGGKRGKLRAACRAKRLSQLLLGSAGPLQPVRLIPFVKHRPVPMDHRLPPASEKARNQTSLRQGS